ncbi:MAG TPA: TerC/Alx family metal homeostasis membrane protein [Bacteroidales bacterium]|nr:TerC/Alx family metal homeostasis membrane protein [Bacteroidales bacterium]
MPVETIFFIVFLLFIGSMLALDLGIFDRHSHEVKFKEALIWTGVWVSFAIGFYFLIYFKGELIHGLDTVEEIQAKIHQYRHQINISNLAYPEAIKIYRHNLALEYMTGYLIEYMLSVDNVFVILLIFISFGVQKMYYKHVLFWGIIGAIVMRFIFIFLSSALIQKFDWVLYIFGIFLVITGIKMFIDRNKQEKIETSKHPVVKFASKHLPVYPHYFRGHFWFRNKEDRMRLYFTPLFLVLLVIEFTDVVFAVDSVPAIFSVTQDPFIVFFSNIFAILGLRSLFFVVAHVISMLRFLKHGLSVLLTFIGFKMLLHVQLKEWGFTTVHSLLVVVTILAVSILASLIWPDKSKKKIKGVTELTGEKPNVIDL